MKLRLDSKYRLRYKSTAYKVFYFIGKSLLFLFILFLLIVGFTQTAYFRNLLREKIIELSRGELNGNLRIESIYGTLFSSLTIKNLSYDIEGVELISFSTAHISINPIELLRNRLVVNKLFLEKLNFNLVKFKDGKWITEKILKHLPAKDTTPPTKFNFNVILKSVNLIDCQFRFKINVDSINYSWLNIYQTFNYSDLLISNIDLNLSAQLNFLRNDFALNIEQFKFNSNVKNFSLKKLRLNLNAKEKRLTLDPVEIKTTRSSINFELKADDFDLSDNQFFEKIPTKIFYARIQADPFDFEDLHSLIPAVDMLNGKTYVQAEANGSLKNLNVDYITIKLGSTILNVHGILQNIDESENMFIKARVVNSEVLMEDVSKFLPLYNIPEFNRLGILKIEIQHEGTPLNFRTNFKINASEGDVKGLSKFNFNKKTPTYFVELATRNLPLLPFTGIAGKLNSNLKITGSGFNPEDINTRLIFSASNSLFSENYIDSLILNIEGKDKKFDFNFASNLDRSNLQLKGLIDFSDKNLPIYKFDLSMHNIDPAKNLFFKNFEGNLNFVGNIKGKSFNPDNLDCEFSFSILESELNKIKIDESKLGLIVHHSSPSEKKIQVRSDFMELDISGNYELSHVIRVLRETSNLVQNEIDRKVKSFKEEKDYELIISSQKKFSMNNKSIEEDKVNFNLTYSVDFKNFDLINIFLKTIRINIDGFLTGSISRNNNLFKFETKGNINDFWIVDANQSIRTRNNHFTISLETDANQNEKPEIKLLTSFVSEKMLAYSKFENLDFTLNYSADLFSYKIQTIVDSLISIRSEGSFDISSPEFKANIEKATIVYKKYKLTNQGVLNFSFTNDKIKFNQFVLRRKKDTFRLSGEIGYGGEQNLNLSIDHLELYDLVLNFFPNVSEEIGGKFSINISINGSADSPIIKGSYDLNDFLIGEDKLGNLSGEINYKDKILNFFTFYVDSIYKGDDLEISGSIPINLALGDIKDRIRKNEQILLSINLNEFNLQPLRAIIPYFKTINGSLNGKVEITGTINDPEFYGSIKSKDVNFLLSQNNLKYSSKLKINLDKNKIILEQFELSNINTSKRGRLYTSAEFEIDSKGIKNLKVVSQGSLLVLANESRLVSPKVYGDLFFETSSPIILQGNYNNYFISGSLNIRESSLIIPPIQMEYSGDEGAFVYKYVDYSKEIDPADLAFMQAEKELRKNKKSSTQSNRGVLSKIRGKIKVSLKNNVSMSLVFSQELNQRLFADLKGEIFYNFSEDQTSTQGEIELTPNSYLVFYQRFLASGKIRFESDLSNPYLDVIATYSDYYVQGDTLNQQVKEVLIKLRLIGNVSELGKNLINNPENIEVYVDGSLDKTKDASDAVAFILVGKFKEDLTAEDKTGTLTNWGGTFQNAANSLLGSVITNFANSILGDVLKNVEFKKIGEATTFSFEGRVKDVRFKVGGGTDVFQNFALANIQIEYPISERLFLRLVRKQVQLQSSKPTEMINEVGIKYKVEF